MVFGAAFINGSVYWKIFTRNHRNFPMKIMGFPVQFHLNESIFHSYVKKKTEGISSSNPITSPCSNLHFPNQSIDHGNVFTGAHMSWTIHTKILTVLAHGKIHRIRIHFPNKTNPLKKWVSLYLVRNLKSTFPPKFPTGAWSCFLSGKP